MENLSNKTLLHFGFQNQNDSLAWRDYLSLLAIQASSAESERLFSAGGWHTEGRKNRLEKEQLTNKVFLSCNKRLFSKVIFSR